MSKNDKATRILQARSSIAKAMLQLRGAQELSDPLTTHHINNQLDILTRVRKTLADIAEG